VKGTGGGRRKNAVERSANMAKRKKPEKSGSDYSNPDKRGKNI